MEKQTDAFDDGVDAYGRGELRENCPYADDTDERQEWLDGWDEAKSLDGDDEIADNI